MNIYIGNLSFDVTSTDLLDLFKGYGQVSSANVIRERFSGESKGFGFIEMPDKTAALSAISELNGKELKGRQIKVSEARPRGRRRSGGYGGNRGGGFRR